MDLVSYVIENDESMSVDSVQRTVKAIISVNSEAASVLSILLTNITEAERRWLGRQWNHTASDRPIEQAIDIGHRHYTNDQAIALLFKNESDQGLSEEKVDRLLAYVLNFYDCSEVLEQIKFLTLTDAQKWFVRHFRD